MNEAYQTWNAVIATLRQRGLLTNGQSPVADGILLPDRLIFVLDMQRLAGIPREAWLDPDLHRQLRAALGGRPVVVTDFFGLAVQVGRQPLQPPQPLPRHIPLDLSHCLPGLKYPVPLGVGRRGPMGVPARPGAHPGGRNNPHGQDGVDSGRADGVGLRPYRR
jgi:hypothetical protein